MVSGVEIALLIKVAVTLVVALFEPVALPVELKNAQFRVESRAMGGSHQVSISLCARSLEMKLLHQAGIEEDLVRRYALKDRKGTVANGTAQAGGFSLNDDCEDSAVVEIDFPR